MKPFHPFVVGFGCGVILMMVGVLWLENEHRKEIRDLKSKLLTTPQ